MSLEQAEKLRDMAEIAYVGSPELYEDRIFDYARGIYINLHRPEIRIIMPKVAARKKKAKAKVKKAIEDGFSLDDIDRELRLIQNAKNQANEFKVFENVLPIEVQNKVDMQIRKDGKSDVYIAATSDTHCNHVLAIFKKKTSGDYINLCCDAPATGKCCTDKCGRGGVFCSAHLKQNSLNNRTWCYHCIMIAAAVCVRPTHADPQAERMWKWLDSSRSFVARKSCSLPSYDLPHMIANFDLLDIPIDLMKWPLRIAWRGPITYFEEYVNVGKA
jgi:hypothetical protein